jgi:serine/threonine protein kinase
MELMKESVRSLLKHQQKLPVPTIIKIAKDVALALHYLHTSNCPHPIVHFDVRSSNILVPYGSSQPYKLSDFGLAAYYTSCSGELQKQYDNQKYPVLWSAPEVLEGKFSPASDVYSFGVLLWELITGEDPRQYIPQDLNKQKELEKWILENDFRLPIPEHDELPATYFQLMAACWNKDPTNRPTAAEILTQLDYIAYQLSQK